MAIVTAYQSAWLSWAAKEAESGRCRCSKCNARMIGFYHICDCGGRSCFAPKGVMLIEDERLHECSRDRVPEVQVEKQPDP